MLKIENNDLDKINEFLSLLNTDLSSIDYIEKDNFFYNAKTKETINHFLTYILVNYKDITDLHFNFDSYQKIIRLRVRKNGNMHDIPITIAANDNYAIAKINNQSFAIDVFKDILEQIRGPSSMETGQTYDFYSDLDIPMFGMYRLRSSSCGHDGITRILKNKNNTSTDINYNILQIKENPIYTIEAELINGGFIHNSGVTFTPEIQTKIDLYESKLDKMFNKFKGKLNIYKYNKIKIVLEYMGNNTINVIIPNTYSIGRVEMNKTILKYVLKHYSDFYDPIFTAFIEDVTQVKFDPIIGEFKTPEAFKDYLTTLDMIKV
jgi:hypothetical protein